jgi:myo-inositol-1(or 4)-monophosphatase
MMPQVTAVTPAPRRGRPEADDDPARRDTLSAMRPLAELRDLAVRAVEAAGEVVTGWRDGRIALDTESKGPGDYVTAADHAAEAAALEVLSAGAPEIRVLAEESAATTARDGGAPLWAVDPIDGTTNFLRGFPVVGVSVGLLVDGMPAVGAIAAPFTGDLWCGARGLGAHDRRGRRLRVAGDGHGVVATGFPFRRPENRARYLPVFEAALAGVEDIRRAGAASLDLAYTAQGTFDGYFELGLSLWDIAAGSLLVLEAGGVVTDWAGDPREVFAGGDVLAGSPAWHERMLDLVQSRKAGAPALP